MRATVISLHVHLHVVENCDPKYVVKVNMAIVGAATAQHRATNNSMYGELLNE
jgi:hypothetical protein